ncbi:MAG: argininosuccinate lyase [Epulopiscium sp. Nele67-Bin002]|nr:MAG: argininosuccinate lyase [Epulopiscium sp. Nuni2H_MBin001]OON91847.1 MAG: argininosuccinate lyase [Epulopiscium sp. Nele67-Bin002]
MKLWAGRFTKATDALTDHFNSSLSFDYRLYNEDITGSVAHVKMLAKQGILTDEECQTIEQGLLEILQDIDGGKIDLMQDSEDIHMLIETLLTNRIGDVGKKLHTGRSRNDQVALDMRLYLRKNIKEIQSLIVDLLNAIYNLATEHTTTFMPGYTHLQRAQPVTFAHHLMAYFEMFKRDYKRFDFCYDMTNCLPLGSGALATTTYPLDRDYVKELLKFDAICENSLDAVSDRDFCVDFLYAASQMMMHLSRFSEEIIIYNSHEFKFIELDDAFSTGSSIMPQKKNPDIAELVRGKTGRCYGNLLALLTTLKGLPLAYNKDMQEDKEAVFDSLDTISLCLPIFTNMLKTITINKETMYKAAASGFTNATDAADYLVKKGVAFRDAHHIVGQLVLFCTTNNLTLETLSLQQYQDISPVFTDDIYQAISIATCVNERNVTGGPSPEAVKRHLSKAKQFIERCS